MSKSRPGFTNVYMHDATHARLERDKEILAKNKLVSMEDGLARWLTFEEVIVAALDALEEKYQK